MDNQERQYRTKSGATITVDHVASLIVSWAEAQLGVMEEGGNNMGREIERYQSIVGKAEGESWCLAFCQAAAHDVCQSLGCKNPLYPTEGCAELWDKHPTDRLSVALPGTIMIQKEYTSWHGHAGIVTASSNYDFFDTIEGNTNETGGREGDGVYRKKRTMKGTSTRACLGFIDLPQLIVNQMRKEGI